MTWISIETLKNKKYIFPLYLSHKYVDNYIWQSEIMMFLLREYIKVNELNWGDAKNKTLGKLGFSSVLCFSRFKKDGVYIWAKGEGNGDAKSKNRRRHWCCLWFPLLTELPFQSWEFSLIDCFIQPSTLLDIPICPQPTSASLMRDYTHTHARMCRSDFILVISVILFAYRYFDVV